MNEGLDATELPQLLRQVLLIVGLQTKELHGDRPPDVIQQEAVNMLHHLRVSLLCRLENLKKIF